MSADNDKNFHPGLSAEGVWPEAVYPTQGDGELVRPAREWIPVVTVRCECGNDGCNVMASLRADGGEFVLVVRGVHMKALGNETRATIVLPSGYALCRRDDANVAAAARAAVESVTDDDIAAWTSRHDRLVVIELSGRSESMIATATVTAYVRALRDKYEARLRGGS